ncbi:hypothetical protein POPTR_011G051712v4 [Populus trichocarpa]|nr:hypothetical protein POPTR_011G051712v4 [Populus trichocarpa]
MQRETNGGPLAHFQTLALQNKPTPYSSPPMHRPHHGRTPEAASEAIGLSPLTRFLHHSPESYLHSLSCDELVMFRICISIHPLHTRGLHGVSFEATCYPSAQNIFIHPFSYQIYHLSFRFFVKLEEQITSARSPIFTKIVSNQWPYRIT